MDLNKLIPSYHKTNIQNFEYTFTIFTSVYNRGNTLSRVFNSLNAQTFKDFELIIINDGSTDNSHDIITKLIENTSFKIRYINNKSNKHKMACYFQAINLANGKFILPFDSDDECTPDALEILYYSYEEIPDHKKQYISGVTCLCNDQNGNLVGEKFPEQPYFSNTFIRQLTNPKSSEKWGFTKTQILKDITINESIFSKGLIPEGLIWNLIAKEGFKTKYINDVLRVYYLDSEGSLSVKNLKKDALGMALYSLSILNWFQNDYLKKHPKAFLKRIYTLLRASKYLDYKFSDYYKAIHNKVLKLIFLLAWPFRKLLA